MVNQKQNMNVVLKNQQLKQAGAKLQTMDCDIATATNTDIRISFFPSGIQF